MSEGPMEYADAQAEAEANAQADADEGEAFAAEQVAKAAEERAFGVEGQAAAEEAKIDAENQAYALEAEEQNNIDLESMKAIRKESRIVSENMKQNGGSFVTALGTAIPYADDINLRKIHDAFPEYWNRYLKMEPISGKTTY